MTNPDRILLAVESADHRAALDLAVDQARLRRCGVCVVHVVAAPAGVGGGAGARDVESREDALDVLSASARTLRERLGDDVTVGTDLHHGDVVEGLLATSRDAAVLVMQRPAPDAAAQPTRAWEVATGCEGPVILVPPGWGAAGAAGRGPVGVLITSQASRATLVAAALAEARLMRVELHPVRPRPEEDRDGVVDALVEESADLGLLVVGRHRTDHGPARLDDLDAEVVRRARCPVLVVGR